MTQQGTPQYLAIILIAVSQAGCVHRPFLHMKTIGLNVSSHRYFWGQWIPCHERCGFTFGFYYLLDKLRCLVEAIFVKIANSFKCLEVFIPDCTVPRNNWHLTLPFKVRALWLACFHNPQDNLNITYWSNWCSFTVARWNVSIKVSPSTQIHVVTISA